MVQTKTLLSRTTAVATAAALVVAALVPALFTARVNAGIPTPRKITMSTSQGGATDVVYEVAFTTDDEGTGQDLQGIVVEFCDNTPIIGDATCTTPTGFDVNEAGLQYSDTIAGGAFAIDAATDANTLILTRTDASNIVSATALTLTLGDPDAGTGDGITNPTAGNHTFYARVLTFDSAAGATGYTSGAPGTYIDAGGVALSTANQLQITSKVQERLEFCVYVGGSCTVDTAGAARISSFNLGNDDGVLDPAGPYVDKTSKFDISTNASSGAVVVFKGDVPMTGGFDITRSSTSGTHGTLAGTADVSVPGSEQFGFCAFQSVAGTSNLTFSAPYNDATCNAQTTQTAGLAGGPGGAGTATFGFNRTDATSASGSQIASKPAGTESTATMAFIGNISYTTEAGIYQTTLTFIATGTY